MLRFLGKSLWLLAILLPLGLLGTLLNVIPFQLTGLIAKRISATPDTDATYKLFPSLVLYPATWILEGLLIGWWLGPWYGVATTLLGPISGRIAIYFHQRSEYFARQARAFLLLRSGWRDLEHLQQLRRDVLERIEALVERYRTR